MSSFAMLQPEARSLHALVLLLVRAASRSSARRSSVSCLPTTEGYCSYSYTFRLLGLLNHIRIPNSSYRHWSAAQSWEAYAESYCFIQNTYYVAWEDDIPMDSDKRTRRLTYYQWVRHRPIGPSPSPTLPPLVTTTDGGRSTE